ncbi:MAG: COX15/CtaA family protein [Synechococcaceae cyanobacterium]|nr:COX15/CtaA family protein [Synechococcaceae cyanobacterium]
MDQAEAPAVLRGRLVVLCAHLVVALVTLVVIGGATRVMEAGLACPDWPLCYGVLLPGRQMNLQVFLEWFHRLDAFVVGVALLVLAGVSVLQRRILPVWLPWAASAALLLVVVQGGLGALTVLRLLEASMVTAHLATALALVLLLASVTQALDSPPADSPPQPRWWLPLALVSGLPLLVQCLVGGAMASRWAVDACLQSGYACQWLGLHRQLAGPAAAGFLILALSSWRLPSGHQRLRLLTGLGALLVAGQVFLGLTTLRHSLSLPLLTIGHQLLAALLVALVGSIWGRSLASPRVDPSRSVVALPPC